MANEGIEIESGLVRLCIEVASENGVSVDKWRRQRRTLERMPSHLAEALFHRLLRRRLLYPSLLEVFQHCIEDIDLKGEHLVDAEWMAYLGAFRHLRSLNIADCRAINSSALWAITGMTSLKEIDLSRCIRVTDAGIVHLLSIPNLEKLCVSETGLTADGITRISALKNLSMLDLGGLPVTDLALSSLQVLTKLAYLDLWGSKISNKGISVLEMFPKLSFLNLAWTNVTKLSNIPSLRCLNMSNCTIHSIFEVGNSEVKAPLLRKLLLTGATLVDVDEAFSHIETNYLSFLDLSQSLLDKFQFLAGMGSLEHLELSFSRMGDDSIELVACVGANLRYLNLSNTRVSSAGVEILAGHVPNLESLSLSQTAIDDVALSYISMMPSLRVINLSNTNIKGFNYSTSTELDRVPSLIALQNLKHLARLNLEDTQLKDASLYPLSTFQELNHLALKSDFLSDISLHNLSSIPKLNFLGIRGAVLSNAGLDSFRPSKMLETLDLRECWLLTQDAITSFQENYPQIELVHELAKAPSWDQSTYDRSTTSQGNTKTLQLRQRGKTLPTQHRFQKERFIDERLKYNREELLELQFSLLSCIPLEGSDVMLPKMLLK